MVMEEANNELVAVVMEMALHTAVVEVEAVLYKEEEKVAVVNGLGEVENRRGSEEVGAINRGT